MTEQAFRGARCGVLDNLVQCPTQHLGMICKEHASQTLGSSSGVICKEATTATLSVVQRCTIMNGECLVGSCTSTAVQPLHRATASAQQANLWLYAINTTRI